MSAPDVKAADAVQRLVAVCNVIIDLSAVGLDEFLTDTRTQWAVEMGLIRIGETISRIPAETLERFPGQPWREMIAMRNFAAHQYDDLDPHRVWRTVTIDIPALLGYLTETVIVELGR